MIHHLPICVRNLFAVVLALLVSGCAGGGWGGGNVPSSPPDTGAYRLRPGDTVLLEVFQEPYMTTRQKILEDGTFSVGLIGQVRIAGETVSSASSKIAARLNERHLVNPQVTLTVENYAPRRFVVWGQVRNPGSFTIPGGENITLPEAIAMAGGNSEIGDLRSVTITRSGPDGKQRMKLNALSPTADDFYIQEGDMIRVSETLF
jgi:protein involved in polysaccharide export with SLBB domain